MRLTDHTDYALRVLMYLNKNKGLVTLSELSRGLKVSKNNLIKVSNQLAKLDLIDTTRGRSGGLMIRQGAGQVTLKEIVSQTEESFQMAECFGADKSSCTFGRGCLLKRSLNTALSAFLDSLGRTTLDDVTPGV